MNFLVNSDGMYFVTIDNAGHPYLWFRERRMDMYNPTAKEHLNRIDLPVNAESIFLQRDDSGKGKIWVNIVDDQATHHRFRYKLNGKFIKETINNKPSKKAL